MKPQNNLWCSEQETLIATQLHEFHLICLDCFNLKTNMHAPNCNYLCASNTNIYSLKNK